MSVQGRVGVAANSGQPDTSEQVPGVCATRSLLARVMRPCTCAQGLPKLRKESDSGSGVHFHVENVRDHSESLLELTHERVSAVKPSTELNREHSLEADPREIQLSCTLSRRHRHYQSGQNDYRCKSLINSKTFSVSNRNKICRT